MKKLIAVLFMVLFAIFAVVDTVHEFVADDTLHYFAGQPNRLFLVAAIGLAGGLTAYTCFRMPSRWQRYVKLLLLGLAASFIMLAGGWFSIRLASLPVQLESAINGHLRLLVPLCTTVIAGLLWFEFYQAYKQGAVRPAYPPR